MKTFRLVAEQSSFIAAANRLDISAAMVSKHVKNLEKQLGVRLLHRNSRSVSLTEAGHRYLSHAKVILDDLTALEDAIAETNNTPRGTLRLTAPVWIACDLFMEVIRDFKEQHPDVCLEIDLSSRLINLIDEGFDLALRCSPNLGDQYLARPISDINFLLVASPKYIEQHGTPINIDDLPNHSLLWYPAIPKNTRELNPHDQESPGLRVNPNIICNNETFLYESTKLGMGIACMPHWLVTDDLQNGELIQVFPQTEVFKGKLTAIYPSRNYLAPKTRCFIDFLIKHNNL